MLLWHFSNYTFMPTISFDYNKEDKARKMLQCHLLGERSRNLLILGPQQQLTMFLFMGKKTWIRTEYLIFILAHQLRANSDNKVLEQRKKQASSIHRLCFNSLMYLFQNPVKSIVLQELLFHCQITTLLFNRLLFSKEKYTHLNTFQCQRAILY